MILVIDNYDSFTYNLVQYLGILSTVEIKIVRNDVLSISEIRDLKPQKILLSPGPGTPMQAGICNDVIKELGPTIPILGVCLGHQCIAHVYGGKVVRASKVCHGKTSTIIHDHQGLFQGLPRPFTATRYHSLLVQRDSLPQDLSVSAWTKDGLIMGLRHNFHPVEGVQFHPESILSEYGMEILGNFLQVGRN